MIPVTIRLEDHCDAGAHSLPQVEHALQRMAMPGGPTFIVLEDSAGNYIQAAGFGDRFCVESRDVYGEGFQHWRATRIGVPLGGKTKVFFRNKCPKNEHPPRGCSLTVHTGEVLGFSEMRNSLLAYVLSGQREGDCDWRDVTDEFPATEKPIQDIRARCRDC